MSAMLPLYNITTQVEVIPSLGVPFFVANLSGQGLRVEWDVQKGLNGAGDAAKVRIFNLQEVTRLALEQAVAPIAGQIPVPPTLVRLSIGWNGIPEQLFFGGAWHVVPSKREGMDIVTEFDVGNGGGASEQPPAGGAAAGVGLDITVSLILIDLGWVPSPGAMAAVSAAAAQAPLTALSTNVFDLDPRDQLDVLLASVGLGWSHTADNEFVVYKGGVRLDVPVVILDPTSGLLNWNVLDDGGVEFEALAQPRVKPGVQIQFLDFKHAAVGGAAVRCEQVSFSGSSEGPSTMSGVARKIVIAI